MRDVYSSVSEQISYNKERAKSAIRILSDEYSSIHCNADEAISYASELCNGACLYCGKELYEADGKQVNLVSNIHLDHIYPASYGGLFSKGNIALSCESCNVSKGQKSPQKYYESKLNKGEVCRFVNVDEFNSFIESYTKPYKENYRAHYELNVRSLNSNEMTPDQIYSHFIKPIGTIKLGRSRHGVLTSDSRIKTEDTSPLVNFTLQQKKVLLELTRVMRMSQSNIIEINLIEFKRSSGLSKLSNQSIIDNMVAIGKLIEETYDQEVTLFSTFELCDTEKTLKVEADEVLLEISEEFNFTRFSDKDIHSYNKLTSKYSQDIYSMLSRHRASGVIEIEVDALRSLINVPKSFSMSNIDKRVLSPALDELSNYYKGLSIEKLRGENNKVEKLEFRFKRKVR